MKNNTLKKEIVMLKDLPNRKDLIGKKINVRRQGGEFHYDYQDKPMYRTLLNVSQYKDKIGTWIEWQYVPEFEQTEYCPSGYDCGYSAVCIDGDRFGNSYLEIN